MLLIKVGRAVEVHFLTPFSYCILLISCSLQVHSEREADLIIQADHEPRAPKAKRWGEILSAIINNYAGCSQPVDLFH